MKRHSFTSQLKSLTVVFGVALAFASCANEDVAQNPTNPNEDNDKNLTTFVAGDETKTRTSLNYNSSDFYWEAGDYIYVKDDDNVLQKSSNAPTNKVASFKYKVPGKFTGNSYKVYYLGKNSNATDKKVTISTAQTQTKPDNTEHFGTAGDYGTATAQKVTGKNQFAFELEHQPAYLVFQPYTSNTILQNCYLTSIEVSSNDDIAEEYTVNPTTGALDASAVTNGKKIILVTQDPTSGSSYNSGFPLTNNVASRTTNGAYMVIKPGTHTLRVRYWVKDKATGVRGTITKILSQKTYAPNTYYDMTANLNVRDYDGTKYYMWDAQQNYWAGHEWNSASPWQPTLDSQPANLNYAQSNSDPRYKNEGGGSGRFDATQSCAGLPNVNEMYWYCEKGDCHWDADELWTTMGHLYKGGMWFKKKAYINGYDINNSPGAWDRRNDNGTPKSTNADESLLSPSEANKYFYLPALGYYYKGQLYNVGKEGYYWSSSSPGVRPGGESAYYLKFSYDFSQYYSYVFYTIREIGARVQAFE